MQEDGGTRQGGRRVGRRWFFVRSVDRNSFVGEVVTLRNTTNLRRNPKSPGKSDVNEATMSIDSRPEEG